MKKFFAALALVSILIIPSSAGAVTIPEGAIVKTADNPDVYIIKYKNNKQFKRLVLNPQVFESYGHLKWENVLTIDKATLDTYAISDFVTVYGEKDVYELVPDGDTGSKYLTTSGYDPDSVYIINETDFRNYVLQELAKINTNISNLQNTVNQLQSATPTPAPAIVYVPVYVPANPEPTPEPTPVPTPEPAFSFKVWIAGQERDYFKYPPITDIIIKWEITNIYSSESVCNLSGMPVLSPTLDLNFTDLSLKTGVTWETRLSYYQYPRQELSTATLACRDGSTGQTGTKTITIDTRK